MTTEELIAPGLPVDPVVEGAENAAPAEDVGSPSGSRSREDGEVQSDDDEDIGDVDAGVSDLVKAGTVGPLPPSLAFGESKATTNMIREYEKVGFFPPGAGRTPLDEQIPTPEEGEVVVFRDFFICGLRFPCDPILPAILDAFSVKIHQLSPTSFLEISKFIWIMKTFGCNLSVHAFCQILRNGDYPRGYQGQRRAVLSHLTCVLHLQHPAAEHPKGDHPNSDCSLLQD
jgi:hypothetical protein